MGDELKALFANPPPGVAVADYEVAEKVEPDGKGIEAYAPLHDYEIKVRGRLTGAVRPLIDFYDKLEQHPPRSPGRDRARVSLISRDHTRPAVLGFYSRSGGGLTITKTERASR
jgi:hypothetical protein